MAAVRVLGRDDLASVIDMPAAIDAVRDAFGRLSAGEARVPQRVALATEAGDTLLMGAALPGACGAKAVSIYPGNAGRGLPVTTGVVLLLDPGTGIPSAVLDGTWLTRLRTGAATALATDLMAAPDAAVLALFGAGLQARGQLEGMRAVRAFDEVRIVSRTRASAEALAAELREGSGAGWRPFEGTVRVVEEPAEAVRGADVIVTATDSPVPVLPGEAVEPGAHVNAIGAYRPDRRELDGALMARARIVVDQREAAAAEAGEIRMAVEEGALPPGARYPEIGEVVKGDAPGRTDPDEITVFRSVGNAVQDVAVGSAALAEAERRGVGVEVALGEGEA